MRDLRCTTEQQFTLQVTELLCSKLNCVERNPESISQQVTNNTLGHQVGHNVVSENQKPGQPTMALTYCVLGPLKFPW